MTFPPSPRRRSVLAAIGGSLLSLPLFVPVPAAAGDLYVVTPEGRASILERPATPFAGAANADITLVEYFDFNCPYCRKVALNINQLVASDPRVRVLYKDWPIFGGVSLYAARAALAANWQGRYLVAHNALIAGGTRLGSPEDVRARLQAAGVDLPRLDADTAAHGQQITSILARVNDEARRFEFQGTPGMVVGDFVVPGSVEVADLRQLVKLSRDRAAAHRP
jgi:protein-disulfide isomerase